MKGKHFWIKLNLSSPWTKKIVLPENYQPITILEGKNAMRKLARRRPTFLPINQMENVADNSQHEDSEGDNQAAEAKKVKVINK